MFAPRVFVCIAVLAASALATNVNQCPGMEFENLNENVQLSPCKQPPCKLKKGKSQAITINFTPETDITDVKNHVTADVFGVELPFVGVDKLSICDKIFLENGDKVECPLKAGTTYTYKDSFPILDFYPTIRVKVHWGLQDTSKNNDLLCFEVPARIVQ